MELWKRDATDLPDLTQFKTSSALINKSGNLIHWVTHGKTRCYKSEEGGEEKSYLSRTTWLEQNRLRPTMRCDRVGEREKNDTGPKRCLELLPYWRACVMYNLLNNAANYELLVWAQFLRCSDKLSCMSIIGFFLKMTRQLAVVMTNDLFALLKSQTEKYCLLIYCERKTLFFHWQSTVDKPSEQGRKSMFWSPGIWFRGLIFSFCTLI